MSCEEIAAKAKEAYGARDFKKFEKLVKKAVRLCDARVVDALAAETAVRDAAYLIARRAIASAMKHRGQKAVYIGEFWLAQTELVIGCASAKAFIAATLRAAGEMRWPWPRWVLVAPLAEAVYRLCENDVDDVAEMLGAEEWPAVESYVNDGAAEVELDGEPLVIVSSWA